MKPPLMVRLAWSRARHYCLALSAAETLIASRQGCNCQLQHLCLILIWFPTTVVGQTMTMELSDRMQGRNIFRTPLVKRYVWASSGCACAALLRGAASGSRYAQVPSKFANYIAFWICIFALGMIDMIPNHHSAIAKVLQDDTQNSRKEYLFD